MFYKIFKWVKETNPVIHCITNYVTVNDCANIILASGGSPIMADDIDEMEAIINCSNALVINIGTLNQRTIKSMLAAGIYANKQGKPVILDPVGVSVSKHRSDATDQLLSDVKFTVIKGNASEIKFLSGNSSFSKGVDASISDSNDEFELIELAKKISNITGAITVITGKTDIITNGKNTNFIKNGSILMSKVTGTGCMLTSLIGCFVGGSYQSSFENDIAFGATTCAVATMGLSGELAYNQMTKENAGIGTYRNLLIDYVGKMDNTTLSGGIKIESR